MLQVHKGINLASGAAVAVKMIGKDKLRRPHERQSIEKEIETMRVAVEQFENGHPHIVRLLCTKESQHHIFIVQVGGWCRDREQKTQAGLTWLSFLVNIRNTAPAETSPS
jgi:hypothetical protein